MKSEPLSYLRIKSFHVLNGRHVLLCSIENKQKIFRENCFENVVSEIHKAGLVLSLKADKYYECFYDF